MGSTKLPSQLLREGETRDDDTSNSGLLWDWKSEKKKSTRDEALSPYEGLPRRGNKHLHTVAKGIPQDRAPPEQALPEKGGSSQITDIALGKRRKSATERGMKKSDPPQKREKKTKDKEKKKAYTG